MAAVKRLKGAVRPEDAPQAPKHVSSTEALSSPTPAQPKRATSEIGVVSRLALVYEVRAAAEEGTDTVTLQGLRSLALTHGYGALLAAAFEREGVYANLTGRCLAAGLMYAEPSEGCPHGTALRALHLVAWDLVSKSGSPRSALERLDEISHLGLEDNSPPRVLIEDLVQLMELDEDGDPLERRETPWTRVLSWFAYLAETVDGDEPYLRQVMLGALEHLALLDYLRAS